MMVIIDYDVGNIGSILNMLKKVGAEATCSSEHAVIETAEKLILPGVGSFDQAMDKLAERGLIPVLNRRVITGRVPILGICLGVQLFARKSEEGNASGLGWLDATVKRFEFNGCGSNLKIPHMGWNRLELQKENMLFTDMPEPHRFYFVHSYHLVCHEEKDVVGITRYGIPFVSMVQKENIFGVQFHPEKSHKFGMQILKNFASI